MARIPADSADMHLLEDGEFLLFNLNFDVNNCRDLLEIPMDFLQYLDPSIENFKFLDLNGLNVDLDSSEISFSFSTRYHPKALISILDQHGSIVLRGLE